MNTSPFLSIIIPVYNTETYLSSCVESILSQDFSDFEVLLVDDGSMDGSGQVCDEYAAKDSRIRVFHKENGGVSSARNLGLDYAEGEWVYFVDSDDELLPDGLQVLVDNISDDVDLVMGGYERQELNKEIVNHYDTTARKLRLSKLESLKTLYHKYSIYYTGWMWLRMFRNNIIQKENIRFDTELKIKEDTLFIAEYICRSNGITSFVPAPIYLYKMRDGSAMDTWRRGFDYKYLDSLSSLVKICGVMKRSFPACSEPVFIAKEAIWARYHDILSRMKLNDIKDEELKQRMEAVVKKEIGFLPSFLIRKKIRNTKRRWMERSKRGLLAFLLIFLGGTVSCAKDENVADIIVAPEINLDTTTVNFRLPEDPRQLKPSPEEMDGELTITPYAEFSFVHQSAAVYGDYAFLFMQGYEAIRLYDLSRKRTVYTLKQTPEYKPVYHCNQASFGVEKYEPEDYFPLLYVSQRALSDQRCFTDVFRIIPAFNADSTVLLAFRTELVQKILFPPMSRKNSMGNVNSVIDVRTGKMYTYSRNNTPTDKNYGQCKISRFAIPDIHTSKVILEDSDIENSFMIDAKAGNMQGGCIVGDRLYIGQGYPYANYVYLNVVDLREEKLVRRYDLLAKGVNWEPEGCIYYDGDLMITYTTGISRIVEEDE